MQVSVIIITKNQKNLLKRSLPVLLKQNLDSGYEIIVVDSGSKDGAKEYVKTLPVKLINISPENFRFARAFNIGAKQAKGKFLVRLSGDVIPKNENFLNEMVKPFTDKTVGGTYGKYTQTGKKGYSHPNFWPPSRFSDEVVRYSVKPNFFRFFLGNNQKYIDYVTSFAGGCLSIRKRDWEKRRFNENLLAGEDAEYAIYLHLIGLDIVYCHKAEVIHEHKIESLNAGFWPEILWRLTFYGELAKLFLTN